MAGIEMKKQGCRKAISDGWKLVSVAEWNGQSEKIKSKFKNDKIYLSDGYWDGQRAHTHPPPERDVLIIPKPAKLEIFHVEKIKDIPFGWRLACKSEAAANLDTVKEILQRSTIGYANLCDGNVNKNGIIEGTPVGTSAERKDYLFIQIAEEAEKGHGSDAVRQGKKGDEKKKGKDKGSGQSRNI